jgi:hypothetical protein
MFAHRISATFDEAYLAELLVRDIMLVRVLPREQRLAIANLLRDKADLVEGL